jgi:hypothetical protein
LTEEVPSHPGKRGLGGEKASKRPFQLKNQGWAEKRLKKGLQICGGGIFSVKRLMLVVGKKANGKSQAIGCG